MSHLPKPDYPPFVSERLTAVTNVPMQFLVSVGIATVILIVADFISNSDEVAELVDVQRTASHQDLRSATMVGAPPLRASEFKHRELNRRPAT